MQDIVPSVTVVMPIRNESQYIGATLRSVLEQDYPRDSIDILVVDGRSTDDTREQVGAMAATDDRIRLLDNPGQFVPQGLNIALREAGGEIIIWLDGHCEIARDYVSHCVEHLLEDDVHCVGGPIETIGVGYEARAIAAAMSEWFGVGGSKFRTIKDRRMFVDTVAFPAYRREVIAQVGEFDEEFVRNQDEEYNYRLRALDGRILLAPDVRSRYYCRSNLRRLWRQYFQYGMYKVRVLQKHPRQMQLRHFVPAAFVSLMMLAIIADLLIIGPWATATLLGSYLTCSAFASVVGAARHGWTLLPLLPITFAVLHFSYGFGWLRGLTRFWNRWQDRFDPRSAGSLSTCVAPTPVTVHS